MNRFLSTTAILVALSGTAYADGHAANFGGVTVQQSDFFASDLIGMRIYNSEADIDAGMAANDGTKSEWDDIGEINDLIVNKDGDVTAVILGIGGFLGMGERDVSVSMGAIKTVLDKDGERFLVVSTSKEELEKAPEFDADMNEEMEAEAEEAEAETEEMAKEAEAETEEMAEETEAETEEMAEEAEAETEEMAEEAEAETEEMATAKAAASEAAMTRPILARPTVKRDGYADVDYDVLTADDLEGARLYGMKDEDVGEVETLILGDDGKISHVLADIGGFLGMGEHTVKLGFDELQIVRKGDGDDIRVYVDSTEEKLNMLPEHDG